MKLTENQMDRIIEKHENPLEVLEVAIEGLRLNLNETPFDTAKELELHDLMKTYFRVKSEKRNSDDEHDA
jgi:hypothetical protein